MDGQLFCPDNSGYAEKRVQSYAFFFYLANFQSFFLVFSTNIRIFVSSCFKFSKYEEKK